MPPKQTAGHGSTQSELRELKALELSEEQINILLSLAAGRAVQSDSPVSRELIGQELVVVQRATLRLTGRGLQWLELRSPPRDLTKYT
jgi:hypothetical protein